jgi:hypothetical protein
MATVSVALSIDAQAFCPTWQRNVAQALFALGCNGVHMARSDRPRTIDITADTDAATIERAERAASLALAAELESAGRVSYHAAIAAALAND